MTIEIQANINLQAHNTLALHSVADAFFELSDEQQLFELSYYASEHNINLTVLGEGSNVVFAPVQHTLIVKNNLRGITRLDSADVNRVLVRVAAGENWHQWILYCCQQKWHGLENLALIPGSVGAAPVQNIGAYGVEVSQFIKSVRVFDLSVNSFVELSLEQCDFAYRNSVFRGNPRYIICAVDFELSTEFLPDLSYPALKNAFQEKPSAEVLIRQICKIRQEKLPDPKEIPNAGSFFKNPIISEEQAKVLIETFPELIYYPSAEGIKLAAGWLIEQAGLKGKRVGDFAMYERQALVLVNYGDSNGYALLQFAELVQNTVFAKFGVTLEIEPVVFLE